VSIKYLFSFLPYDDCILSGDENAVRNH
jgi:hypothetical protein